MTNGSRAGTLSMLAAGALAALFFCESSDAGERHYAPGVTDSEIKIGQTNPYSGPTSMWGVNGRADQSFFKMIDDRGGVNGRKLMLISLDDGYSPPKTIEQTRKLVEQENVAFIYRSLGTAPNSAIAKYLNDRQIPQLLIASGPSKWNDPEHLPWSMSSMMSYRTEARLYGRYILATRPGAKIAVLYQNDDLGKDFSRGLTEALGAQAKNMILRAESYEVTDATVDSQIVALQGSGADTLFLFAASKQSAQAIRKAYDLGWRPQTFIASFSSVIGQTLEPAGVERSTGVITALSYKDPTDPQWQGDAEVAAWDAWMQKYNPGGDRRDPVYATSFAIGTLLVEILTRCGDELTRENIMRQATGLHDLRVPMMLPSLTVSTSPTDFRVLRQARLVRFDGQRYVPIGAILSD